MRNLELEELKEIHGCAEARAAARTEQGNQEGRRARWLNVLVELVAHGAHRARAAG